MLKIMMRVANHPETNNSGDNDLGLIYMIASFYVPGIGRFASADTIVPDPADPQSLNRYTYTRNNPLKYIDPSGHCQVTSKGGTDPNDQACWDQFLSLYAYLQEQEVENSNFLLGPGKDWQLIETMDTYATREGTVLPLMYFLGSTMKNVQKASKL